MSYRGNRKGNYGAQNQKKVQGGFRSGKKQKLADGIAAEKRRLENMIAAGDVGDMSYVHGALDAYRKVENMMPLDSLWASGNRIVVNSELANRSVFENGEPTKLGKLLDDQIIDLAQEILKANSIELDGNEVATLLSPSRHEDAPGTVGIWVALVNAKIEEAIHESGFEVTDEDSAIQAEHDFDRKRHQLDGL